MEQLALIIDEEELNRYILSDLTQAKDDDSSPISASKRASSPPPQASRERMTPPTPTRRRKSAPVEDDTAKPDVPHPSLVRTASIDSTRSDLTRGAAVRSMVNTPTGGTKQSVRSQNSSAVAVDLTPRNDACVDESRELSLDLSGEFDNLIGSHERDSYPTEWDAQFSQEFDIQQDNKPGDHARKGDFGFVREPSGNGMQQGKDANDAGSLAQQRKHSASRSPQRKQAGLTPPKEKRTETTTPHTETARSLSQPAQQARSLPPLAKAVRSTASHGKQTQMKPTGSAPQQTKVQAFSMEWSTNFHSQDPFQRVGKKNEENEHNSVAAGATRIDEEWKPDFDNLATPVKPKKRVTFISPADTSISNSQTTPPETYAPADRKSSPNSVLDFREWKSRDDSVDEMRHVIQVHKPSDDCSSLGSHDEADNSFRVLRKRPTNLFKGCVKCFLDV